MRQIITFNNKNVILPEPWVQPKPANNEIWYTSSDGNIVTPYQASSLPTIVSNTYVDGKGIIKCASDITNIGRKAFSGCTKLTSISIPSTVISIEYNAFYGCSGLTSMIFPNAIKTIGNYVFENCISLTSVTIHNSVTSIGEGAFISCRNLTSITYTGTIAQYNSISKGLAWNGGVPATVVHCSDGDAPI